MSISINNNTLTIEPIKPHDTNKEVKRDGDWYYVILGAFNVFNANNEFYLFDGIKSFISDPKCMIYKRLKGGYLKGEWKHPEYIKGMSKNDFIRRNIKIDTDRTSHHIRSIDLKETDEITPIDNRKVVEVWGWVKPEDNDFGRMLKANLDDPDINVPFSVRTISKRMRTINGTCIKKVLNWITYDAVELCGIERANQWNSAANTDVSSETNTSFEISEEDIKNLVSEVENDYVSNEDKEDIKDVFKDFITNNNRDILSDW